jgi:DNA-binding response OmpR family regulator
MGMKPGGKLKQGRWGDGENFPVPIAPYPQRRPQVPQSRTIIITLTASTLEEERAVALSAGCDDFIRKLFREVDFLEVMNKHLGVQYVYDESAYQQDSTPTQTLTLTLEALNALPTNW